MQVSFFIDVKQFYHFPHLSLNVLENYKGISNKGYDIFYFRLFGTQ